MIRRYNTEVNRYDSTHTWIVFALTLAAAGILLAAEAPRKTPVQPMSFEEAAKRHEALVREYRENTAKTEQLTKRNDQILVELNYLSGYLDALLHVTRTVDRTNERGGITSASLLLQLPPPRSPVLGRGVAAPQLPGITGLAPGASIVPTGVDSLTTAPVKRERDRRAVPNKLTKSKERPII